MIYLYVFISVIIVSLVSFVGVFTLGMRPNFLKKITLTLVSLSAGTLLGGAFLHLLPEAIELGAPIEEIFKAVLVGIIFFFILEKIVCWRHCHIPTSESHPHHLGLMNLVGDAAHNFFDGIVIAGAFLASAQIGIATTLAVILHEIPQEIADFGVLMHAGYSRKKALMLNFLIALMAMLGAAVTLIIGTQIEGLITPVIAFTAGGFIYIATSDLMPELKKESGPLKSLNQLLIIILGIILAWLA